MNFARIAVLSGLLITALPTWATTYRVEFAGTITSTDPTGPYAGLSGDIAGTAIYIGYFLDVAWPVGQFDGSGLPDIQTLNSPFESAQFVVVYNHLLLSADVTSFHVSVVPVPNIGIYCFEGTLLALAYAARKRRKVARL